MNKVKLTTGTALVLMALTTSAFADTTQGAYAGLGIGAYSGDVTISNGGSSFTAGNDSLDIGASVYGGYKWNMGVGSVAAEVSYLSNAGKLATWSSPGASVNGKLTDNWSVSVLPGYNFSKDTTGYVRLGYTQAQGDLGNLSHTFTGTIWGLGVDQAFTKNLSGRLEYQALDLNSYTDSAFYNFKPNSSGINVSVRYAF